MTGSARDQILIIHLGGLGDVCLSESTFFSLARHFGEKLVAVGNLRFLSLFPGYFSSIHSVEGREWLYLFADGIDGPEWRRIIFVGKDRSASFRDHLAHFSREDLLFIDLYPDSGRAHVEKYQLIQLRASGIVPVTKPIPMTSGKGIVLYPEKGYTKKKWPYESFFEVYDSLRNEGYPAYLLEPFDTDTPCPGAFRLEKLSDVVSFLNRSDIFVSNDCGVAHLAASCGLSTVTLFHDTDPSIWHPLGDNRFIHCTALSPSADDLFAIIESVGAERRIRK